MLLLLSSNVSDGIDLISKLFEVFLLKNLDTPLNFSRSVLYLISKSFERSLLFMSS